MIVNNVSVKVMTEYLPEQSIPEDNRYVFAYHVNIRNDGSQTAQLISRHWIMTDGNDKIQEVKGMGVVGAQPFLQPGESYQYTSGTVIETVVGTMQGSYQMQAEDGSLFDAIIPPFTLAMPNQVH